MKRATIRDTLTLGAEGKKAVMRQLERDGFRITSLLEDKIAQSNTIDFLMTKNGKEQSVFVRSDTQICESRNIFLETYMHRRKIDPLTGSLQKGWYFTGKADVLCYLDAQNGTAWFFDWTALRNYARDVVVTQREFHNRIDARTQGQGYVFPVRDAENYPGVLLWSQRVNVSSLKQYIWSPQNPF